VVKRTDNPAPALGDLAIWAEAMRDVIPLRGRRRPALPDATEPRSDLPPAANGAPSSEASQPAAFAGIDRANAERLKRGRHPIEARLDLHGMTQAEAHRALVAFVESGYGAGQRCVLVITGRGLSPDGAGVLKTAVPRWLGEAGLRRRILAVASAQPRHGGAGALYLLLRRQR
jgi:DNA-nicking Smr family endonuclease